MSERDTATINEIADVLKIARRVAHKKAMKECWQFKTGPRNAKLYYIEGLPQEIKLSIMAHRAKKMSENADIPISEKSRFNGQPIIMNINFNIYISENK